MVVELCLWATVNHPIWVHLQVLDTIPCFYLLKYFFFHYMWVLSTLNVVAYHLIKTQTHYGCRGCPGESLTHFDVGIFWQDFFCLYYVIKKSDESNFGNYVEGSLSLYIESKQQMAFCLQTILWTEWAFCRTTKCWFDLFLVVHWLVIGAILQKKKVLFDFFEMSTRSHFFTHLYFISGSFVMLSSWLSLFG